MADQETKANPLESPFRVYPGAKCKEKFAGTGKASGKPFKKLTFIGMGYPPVDCFVFGPDGDKVYGSISTEISYDVLIPIQFSEDGERLGNPVLYPDGFFKAVEAAGKKQMANQPLRAAA